MWYIGNWVLYNLIWGEEFLCLECIDRILLDIFFYNIDFFYYNIRYVNVEIIW